ncbi:Mitochondrial import inner membrane translocase subunit tim21 [Thalictrum thalictroides]|uniref:Mitochondrial import inner membrane translocase subunit Tim21 n=1 Tax=Thalictrum thalictroides TaxID=46969 RepID=A0A7J6VVZ4_THATH|nr:Mitochondrial import inner membrane translocase subunit tim21 [Thalictrum thalictroides]
MSFMKYNKALKSGILLKNSLISILKSQKEGLTTSIEGNKMIHDVGFAGYSSMVKESNAFHTRIAESVKDGAQSLFRGRHIRENRVSLLTPNQLNKCFRGHPMHPCFTRSLASTSAPQPSGQTHQQQNQKDISTTEDIFDAPTYNIPEKPVTFTEGASYSVVILAGLAVVAIALYGVFGELIFVPSEQKVFGKALERVQNDSQVRMRIGSPIKGYGQESMNRRARQQIPSRKWTDEDGVERVEVRFVIRGPHGHGIVQSQMFKDKEDKSWKFTVLIVEIKSPTPVALMLESYIPA